MARDLSEEFGLNQPLSETGGRDLSQEFNLSEQGPTQDRTGFAGLYDAASRGAGQIIPTINSVSELSLQSLSDIISPKLEKTETNPLEYFKKRFSNVNDYANLAVSGIAKGTNEALNVPGNLRDSLVKYFPDQLGNSPSARLPESIANRSGHDYLKDFGAPSEENMTATQRMLYEALQFMPSTGIAKGAGVTNKLLAPTSAAINAAGADENIVTAAGASIVPQIAAKVAPKVVKVAKAAPKKIATAAKDVGGNVLDTASKTKLGGQVSSAWKDRKTSKENATSRLDVEETKVQQKINNMETASDISDVFKNRNDKTSKEVRNGLIDKTQASHEAMKNESNINYDAVIEPNAKKRIFSPIEPKYLDKKYDLSGKDISSQTKRKINETIGTYSETSKRNSLTGKPEFTINKNNGTQNVGSYIELMRELSNEHWFLLEQSKKPSVKNRQKQLDLQSQAENVKKIHDDVKSAINGTLSEKGNRDFAHANKYYKENIVGFRENSALQNILGDTPVVTSKSFIRDVFGKKGNASLMETMFKDQSVKEAFVANDMHHKNVKDSKGLSELIRDDVFGELTPAERSKVKRLYEKHQTEKSMLNAAEKQLLKLDLSKIQIDKRMGVFRKVLKTLGKKAGAVYLALNIIH